MADQESSNQKISSPKKNRQKISDNKITENQLNEMSNEDILKLRFKNIHFDLSTSEYQKCIEQLYEELDKKGLKFKPQIFVGDEWFSPEGMNAIAIPFYLIYPRLKSLEKSLMLEVEGDNTEYFMKLLRHEAGHCFDHCYRFSRRKIWSTIFGSPNQEYQPDRYRPQPYSKSFVRHLDRWYAQAHPDEDFAETFAVWLNPDSQWESTYKSWPVVLKKLKFIDTLAQESQKLKNSAIPGRVPSSVKNLNSTLEKYYQRRKKEQADEYPDFYDDDLKLIFNGDSNESKKELLAFRYMVKNRKNIVSTVTWATHERKITVDALVKRLVMRCKELQLKLGENELITTMKVTSYLTSLVKNYLFTGKFKREV